MSDGSLNETRGEMSPYSGHNIYGMIPNGALRALDERFRLGTAHYGEEAWNGVSANWEKLDDIQWVAERLNHAFTHIQHFINVLNGTEKDDGDDDGGAVMWCGAMMHEAYLRRKRDPTAGPTSEIK